MFGKMMVRSSIAAMRFVLGVILAFTLAVVHADTIYVCNANSNTVERFTPSGVGSVFATGLNNRGLDC